MNLAKNILFGSCASLLLLSCNDPNPEISWVSSTETTPWQQQSTASITAVAQDEAIEIYLDQPLQQIDGFGACFNELGWTSLSELQEEDRTAIMKELFEPGSGANFSYCRMPVAANDFARDWYSYDETEGDFAMEHFSIDNDKETLIPFIKAAQQQNAQLQLWASPWSPPQWMKYNKHYALNTVPDIMEEVDNGIKPDQLGKEGEDIFIQKPEYFEAYALYFEKFIKAYHQQGIDISMVMPQNEFNSAQWYPSATWTPEGLTKFIEILAPKMDALGVKTFFGTLERPNALLFEKVYEEAHTKALIDGLGVQWAGKEAIVPIHQKYSDLKIYQTEHECGNGENSWAYTEYGWDLIKHYLLNGANAYFYWNISLLDGGVSRWGWKQNSLVSVNKDQHSYKWNNDYYLMKHISHFVKPGAHLLKTSSSTSINHRNDVLGWWEGDLSDNVDNLLAFANPDGSIVIVAYNEKTESKPLHINIGPTNITPNLAPKSFNTFIIQQKEDK